VCKLQTKGQDEGKDPFDKRLAVYSQAEVGGFVSEVNSDSPIFACPFGCVSHVSAPGYQVSVADGILWR
jgi:hypothetical protein